MSEKQPVKPLANVLEDMSYAIGDAFRDILYGPVVETEVLDAHVRPEQVTDSPKNGIREGWRELATDIILLLIIMAGVLILVLLWQLIAMAQLDLHQQNITESFR